MKDVEEFAAILNKLGDRALDRLWRGSRQPGAPMKAQRDKDEVAIAKTVKAAEKAKQILVEGLTYHEHDGHNMPKKVARAALEALGVPMDKQP